MNRPSIHLFIFGILGLLVFLISSASAECVTSPNCDCDAANIKGCKATSVNPGGLMCGRELGCDGALSDHIYQSNGNGGFCHFGSCKKGCTTAAESFCNK